LSRDHVDHYTYPIRDACVIDTITDSPDLIAGLPFHIDQSAFSTTPHPACHFKPPKSLGSIAKNYFGRCKALGAAKLRSFDLRTFRQT
jgi:hypothetical protein